MKEKLARIGTHAQIKTEWGFDIYVEILDYKNSYGRDRWLVKPVSGQESAWVEKLVFNQFNTEQ